MLTRVSVKPGEITVGKKLPWPVYDSEETLLLQEQSIISSEKQLNILLEKGLYRGLTPTEKKQQEQQEKQKAIAEQRNRTINNPFEMENSCALETQNLLDQLSTMAATGLQLDVSETTQYISKQISHCCKVDANSTLAAVHLAEKFSYSSLHPLHTAILCELLMRRLSFSNEQKQTVISAALTMNIGMYELQNELFSQTTPLTDEQKQRIQQHPQTSVEMLKAAGVTDSHWLTIVAQHHERINGDGYPEGLKDKAIHQGAKVVALADMYAAMITPRAYRKPVMAQQALKDIFNKRGKEVDDKLTQMLIREVGIYPPGSFVTLANGDTAAVVKRATVRQNGEKTAPFVCSIISPRGGIYQRYQIHDTAKDMYKIIGICQPDFDEPIDYPKLWGFL